MPALQPWERQQEEGVERFEAFKIYLEMGAERSIRKAAEQLDKSKALLERWSSEDGWSERCRAFDNYMLRKEIETLEKERVRARRNHANIARMLQSTALDRLRLITPDEIAKMPLATALKIASVGIRIERESLGEATSRTGKDTALGLQEKFKERARQAWEESPIRYPKIPEQRRLEIIAEHFGIEPEQFLSWIGVEKKPIKPLPPQTSESLS